MASLKKFKHPPAPVYTAVVSNPTVAPNDGFNVTVTVSDGTNRTTYDNVFIPYSELHARGSVALDTACESCIKYTYAQLYIPEIDGHQHQYKPK